jgi:hypothetical protein
MDATQASSGIHGISASGNSDIVIDLTFAPFSAASRPEASNWFVTQLRSNVSTPATAPSSAKPVAAAPEPNTRKPAPASSATAATLAMNAYTRELIPRAVSPTSEQRSR